MTKYLKMQNLIQTLKNLIKAKSNRSIIANSHNLSEQYTNEIHFSVLNYYKYFTTANINKAIFIFKCQKRSIAYWACEILAKWPTDVVFSIFRGLMPLFSTHDCSQKKKYLRCTLPWYSNSWPSYVYPNIKLLLQIQSNYSFI